MNKKEWCAKLEEWAFDDARLHRIPLALLSILAEHLANEQAAQQSVQSDGVETCADCKLEYTSSCPSLLGQKCQYFQPRR